MHRLSRINIYHLLLIFILTLGVLAHGVNMFRYPSYAADEGTYMSQAWSLATHFRVSPYVYLYDHAPAGWILLALWAKLSGGFHTFGFSINSGRVLMLILQLLSSLLIYGICTSLYKHKYAGLIAVFLFMFSPLALLNHRWVLLDNIMTFWVLLSLFVLTRSREGRRKYILSGILLGIAILTKETALSFIPAFVVSVLYFGLRERHKLNTLGIRLVQWLIPFALVVSLYPLYALSRGQLFQNDSGIWLLKTFGEQLQRGRGSMLDFANSDFWRSSREWYNLDPVLLITGLIATLVNLGLGLRYRYSAFASLFSLAILAYLARGGLVFQFYVIPWIPFLSINTEAMLLHIPPRLLKTGLLLFIMGFLISALYHFNHINTNENLYTSDQTNVQIQAANYLKNHASPGSRNIIENYAYVDLNDNDMLTRHFDYYWKVEFDRDTRENVFGNDYRNVEYILAAPDLYSDISHIDSFTLVSQAVQNSRIEQHFENDGWYVDVRKRL